MNLIENELQRTQETMTMIHCINNEIDLLNACFERFSPPHLTINKIVFFGIE